MYKIGKTVGINIFWCFVEIYIFIVNQCSFIYNFFFPNIKDSIIYIKDGKEYQTWDEKKMSNVF